MDNKRTDIQQIQKYLNGELDAKAMHRLEREAQDDPFLMDALEGYGQRNTVHQPSLDTLKQRLQDRTAAKTRRLVPWTVITIAASVLGFAVVLAVLYKGDKAEINKQVAINKPGRTVLANNGTVTDKKSTETTIDAPEASIAYAPRKQESRAITAIPDADKAKSPTPLNEVQVADNMSRPLPDSSAMEDRIMGYIASKKQDTVLGGGTVPITNNAANLTMLNSRAKGVETTTKPGRASDNNAYALMKAGLPPALVSGVVLDRNNGLPLPGASVKVVGKPIGTQTDVNGKFTLPNVKKEDALAVNYMGYNGKTLNVKDADSLKVELDQSSGSLNEVVVMPLSRKKAKGLKASPAMGWDNFKKYLNDNAVSTDERVGTVKLTFTVNADGSKTNFRITQSLSTAADAKAISLINNGPAWNGNANGKAEEIKLTISFTR